MLRRASIIGFGMRLSDRHLQLQLKLQLKLQLQLQLNTTGWVLWAERLGATSEIDGLLRPAAPSRPTQSP
jgi:hypothetical protein